MEPFNYNDLKIYKGSRFTFSFRLALDGEYIEPPVDIIFTASNGAGGTQIIQKSYSESPTSITFDEDDVYTVELSDAETDEIEEALLYFQVDTINAAGKRDRWIIGHIKVYDDAVSS